MQQPHQRSGRADDRWLLRYYLTRAIVSACWVALAFLVGRASPLSGLVLAAIYPAWDCLANYHDARRNGGLGANPTQAINVVVSAIVTIGVIVAAGRDFHAVVGVFGIWAILAGLMQLSTAVRRWRGASAQWPMILSGAQSAFAGSLFIRQAVDPASQLSIASIAPYAALGAIYFAVSASILAIASARQARRSKAAG